MKKLAYLLVLVFTVVVINTSCTKDNTVVPDQKSEYLGFWYNDSTYVNGVKDEITGQSEFEFQDVQLIETQKQYPNRHRIYSSWKIVDGQIECLMDGALFYEYYDIVTPPTNGKMVLNYVQEHNSTYTTYTYYLSK